MVIQLGFRVDVEGTFLPWLFYGKIDRHAYYYIRLSSRFWKHTRVVTYLGGLRGKIDRTKNESPQIWSQCGEGTHCGTDRK